MRLDPGWNYEQEGTGNGECNRYCRGVVCLPSLILIKTSCDKTPHLLDPSGGGYGQQEYSWP